MRAPFWRTATYLGHTQTDIARGVAVNTSGEAYVVGETTSSSFPATITFGSSLGGKDAFVMRFSSSMTSYYYSARLAGVQDEVARAVAVDASDNPIVTGSTTSPVFADGTWSYASTGRGAADVFVTKLVFGAGVAINALIGGSGADEGYDVAVDSGGIYVVGSTKSLNYPTTAGVVDQAFGGGTDALVTKLNTSLSGLTFSTYLGGSASEAGNAIAAVGNSVFVAGYTSSSGFPTSATGADKTYGDGAYDAFVLKLDSLTNVMQYSTFIGGNGSDQAFGLAVDASGNAYVAGSTTSVDLPVVGAPASVGAMGGTDAFLAKVSSAGNSLLMSFRLGGASYDVANDVAVDASGSLYVVGYTTSNPFLTVSALQGGPQGSYDAFVSKLDTAVSPPTWVYSTHLGGSGADFANGVATDGFGNAFVVGETRSSNFPIAGGPLQTSLGGSADAFVTKLDSAGSALLYSTYFGGTSHDIGRDIAVNAGGEAYIVGESTSVDLFDVWGNCFTCLYAGHRDGFIAKFDAGATSLWYGTYLGGSGSDSIYGIHVDPASGTSTFVGQTSSSNHPVLNPLPGGNAISGVNDVIVGQIVEDGSGMFSGFTFISYVGGAGYDQGRDVAVSNGDAFITGMTQSSDFDTTVNAYDSSFNGDGDVFVTRIDL